ncbi:MAG: gamma-glutamyltransferase family protein [Erysipelotrichaceae bacterium]|nr:gamma-glutamyltransferase family protein [Erysipelotrichaceae bacterium]
MFDPLHQPYASNRYCITAGNGIVASGSALATEAGLEVMKKGGNAVDAAVAAAAALTVVEPTANGLGSDAFALVWIKDKLYGLNGSGYSPYDISIDKVLSANPDGKMPRFGWTPVMVPGAVKSWGRLIERFGKLDLKQDLEPAIRYAQDGYPVSPLLSKMWENAARIYHSRFDGKKEYEEWFRVFTKEGEPYRFGEIVKLPDHAKTLKLIADTDTDAFYKGEIAKQFVKQSQRDGGFFSLKDLEDYDVSFVEPIKVNYRGYDVYEIPPNGQGIVALMALNMLKEFRFENKEDVETYHKQIEAMKIAFADGKKYVSDPSQMKIDYNELLSPDFGAMRSKLISKDAGLPGPVELPASGTVYLCTADKEGNMVSYIQSNYMGFGSGIVLEGYGVALQNRGADFSLNKEDANALMPHKKSYHTIIPGFLAKDGKPIGPFGVMGGYMQPQGHVQVLMDMIDFGLNPQMALDAPRWQWLDGKRVIVEPSFDEKIVEGLRKRGHEISYAQEVTSFGRGQIIWRLDNGVLVAGTESRTDSNIACY